MDYLGPAASAVILADRPSNKFEFTGIENALQIKTSDIRIFGKPTTRKHRRMGVALARGKSTDDARRNARLAAKRVKIKYAD